MNTTKSPLARLDKFISIKNGYSFWTHLLPFSVAALLLLVMSVPEDNLLLRLVKVLERPSWVWIPTALLTFVASLVYIVSINVQVRRAYLWSDGDLRRTVTTSFTYIILCTLMAYGVLQSTPSQPTSWGVIWACLLLAVLSLTGIGWSGPNSWVESLGIKSPDYTEARLSARRLTDILQRVRDKPCGAKRDIEDFLKAVENLYSDIRKNLELEPEWAKCDLQRVMDEFRTLTEQTKELFPTDNRAAVESFAAACSCLQQFQYAEFIATIKTLSNHWHEWQCPEHR